MMKLINRSKQSPIGRRACDVALAAHLQTYGDYGRSKMKETYTVKVEGVKVWVEVVNRKNKKALALDSFYEAFNLNSLQPGSVIVVTTQSGMTIQIHKPKEEK